jgi:predicted ATPase
MSTTSTDILSGVPRRFVITGGPSAGKEAVIEAILAAGLPCSAEEAAREIYRAHRARLGRHLQREDRRAYSREVLQAFIDEYRAHTTGVRFYNRGIPDGYGWDRFFGLEPYPELEEATGRYRYDTALILDPLDTFEDENDVVWAQDREIRRVHELIVQGYYDAGYAPVFVPADDPGTRLDFICANLRLPRPTSREEQS